MTVVPTSSAAPPLVGRVADLAALDAALEQARGGEVVTVVLAGDAGIGKTRLVHEFSERAYAQGARLLAGACVDAGDVTLPYGAVMDALRAVPPAAYDDQPVRVRRALATLIPEAAPDDEPADGGQSGVFGAALRLVEQLGRESPLVLVLEDVQWADGSTAALVRFLAGGLRQTAVLLVLTYRTDELARDHPARQLLAELRRAARTRHHTLAPLTREQTAGQLAALTGGDVDGTTLDAIHARSEGNPFYSEELLAALAGAGGAVPATLRDTLVARLDRLPGAAQGVVRVAAACGRQVDHDLLVATCGLDDAALDGALRACVTGHVLAVDAQRRGYRFRHGLLQEVAAGELLPGEGRRLHGRIADLLAARPARSGTARAQQLAEIAHHRLQGLDQAAALAAAVHAARAAERVHALTEAARNYDAALELWEHVDDPETLAGLDLPFLLERAAECRWLGFGDVDISLRLQERAVAEMGEGASRLRRAEYLSRLATTSCYVNLSVGLPLHQEALRLLEGAAPSEAVARVQARYACVLMLTDDFAAAEPLAMEAVEVARAAGASAQEADALITWAVCRAAAGDLDAAESLLAHARPHASEIGDLRVVQRFFTNASHIYASYARYEDAIAIAREGLAIHARAGLERQGSIGVRENAAGALCALGRPVEALEILGDDPFAVTKDTICLHVRWAEVAALLGDLDGAADRVARALAIDDLEPLIRVPLYRARIDVALWRGEHAVALDAARAGDAAIVETGRMDAVPLLATALRAQADAVAAGVLDAAAGRAEADRLLARLERIAGIGGAPLPEINQHVRAGRAERARLADEPDPEPWRVAVAGWEALRRPYDVAYANFRLAEAIAAARGAREELEEALLAHGAATALGAGHLAVAAAALARRARVALPGGVRDDDDAGAFAELTPREREVLGLIADGRTNRQIAETLFITQKTASVHVSNILAKLDVANRGAAAALAHRAGFVE